MSRPTCFSAKEDSGGSRCPSTRRPGIFLSILFLISFPNTLPRAQAQPLRTLTTAHLVHELPIREAARGYPVDLRGVVTFYNPYIDSRWPAFFVTDASGSIFIGLTQKPAPQLKPGDQVEVKGVSAAGDFAPIVNASSVRLIGQSPLPTKAPRVSMAEMLTSDLDGQWVEIEGVVYSARRSGKSVFLDISTSQGATIAVTVAQDGVDYASLVDARVSLRGNVAPLFNYHGQLTGSHLFFPNLSTLHVEEAAPADPFDLPVEASGNLLRFTPGTGLHHRVHLRGAVTLLRPGRMLCLQDGPHGLCADTRQTSYLSPGDRVDVIGFPAPGEFTPTLMHATFRAATGHQSLPPFKVTAEEAIQGLHDADVVTVEGRVIAHDRTAADPTIVLSSGKVVFAAVLSSPSEALKLEEGTQVSVTGICALQSNGAETTSFPVARSMRILLRSPSDIAVVHRPSWWNAQHALTVLAVALISTVAALIFALSLGRRVKRQAGLLKKSEEQFRHLASHDGLTKLPNRNAILNVLSSSLESGRGKRGICVAIVDLDHFKQINDTYGHLAGDEVLRQAAARLDSSIRVTDAIGRLGGEEFLIVLQDVNREIGVERCESIRCAIGCEPVCFDNHIVPITCSIGVAYTEADGAIPTALIARADEALYKAKTAGRNRVELSLPEPALSAGDGPRTHSPPAQR